jgi:hypothetical protein
MKWLILGWASGAALWGAALVWSSRYRRDRNRPTGGLQAVFGGLIGPLEILASDTYDADKPRVVWVVRAAAIVSAVLFFTGLVATAAP